MPAEELADLFHDEIDIVLARLMVRPWDGDTDGLCKLIEYADVSIEARLALFLVLSSLTFEKRMARANTEAFLAAYGQRLISEDDAPSWVGWASAVARLGLTSLAPLLEHALALPIFADLARSDCAALADLLTRAVSRPDDEVACDLADYRAIDTPVDALSWLKGSGQKLKLDLEAMPAESGAAKAELTPEDLD